MLEAYFLMSISAVYEITKAYQEGVDSLNLAVAIITIIYLIAFPVLSMIFLLKNLKRLQTKRMISKYGSLYQNVDPTRPEALMFTTLFCFRRLHFSLLICILSDSIVLQIMAADFLILAMLAFYTSQRPMKDAMNNAVQIFNEVAIILLL